MKSVNEVLTQAKGEGNVNKTLTGKGAYSQAGFGTLVSAMVNDTTKTFPHLDKSGKTIETNISELIRAGVKKTIAAAGYPQKSEIAVIDTVKIDTTGIPELIQHAVQQQVMCGKKFDLPNQKETVGSIYLAPVAGKTKTVQVRDIKTKEELGTTTITTKDSIQLRAKSPVPKHLQTKVRRDKAGNVVK